MPYLRRLVSQLTAPALLFAAYFIVGKLGLQLAFAFPSATPVWPATGLAFVGFLLLGTRVWPAIFAAAFLVNLTTAGTVLTSLGIATGNTLEGIVGAWLVNRYAGGADSLRHTEGIFKFALFAAMLSTMVSATFGVVSLRLAGLVPYGSDSSLWITWWLGDLSGDLIIAPFLLTWAQAPRLPPRATSGIETLALFGSLALVGVTLFGGLIDHGLAGAPLEFICIPFLIWAAVRLGPREATTATLLLGAMAIWGTLHGNGSFVRQSTNASLLLLQAYMGVAAIMTLTLAAAVVERRDAEEQLRTLSISDPLTGIANYRQLITSLDTEIERALRNGRRFAVLFLDVDGLKSINDHYGHIVGSRALCRVAEVLRGAARVVDTAARYGGDEFALLLPETAEAEAWQVGRRLQERLAADEELPPVTVSIGVAVHPEHGTTAEMLLGEADRRLYQGRSRTRSGNFIPPGPPPA